MVVMVFMFQWRTSVRSSRSWAWCHDGGDGIHVSVENQCEEFKKLGVVPCEGAKTCYSVPNHYVCRCRGSEYWDDMQQRCISQYPVVSVSILLCQSVSSCISQYLVVSVSIMLYQSVCCCISQYHVVSVGYPVVPVSIMLCQSVSCCTSQYRLVSVSILLYQSVSYCVNQYLAVSVSIV